jgi:hypothetical protein
MEKNTEYILADFVPSIKSALEQNGVHGQVIVKVIQLIKQSDGKV